MNNKIKILIFFLFFHILFIKLGTLFWQREGLFWSSICLLLADTFIYFFSEKQILSFFPKFRELEGQDPWGIFEIAKPVIEKARISSLKIVVLETDTPQAFALGKSSKTGTLIFTETLLENFKPEEIEALVAYQVASIHRLDTFIYSIVYFICAVFFFFTFFFDKTISWLIHSKDEKNSFSNKNHLMTCLFLPFLLLPLRFLLNSSNYFKIDQLAASYIKDPKILAQVLWKMDSYSSTNPLKVHPKLDHFFIVSTLSSKAWRKYFLSHPKTEERIKRLTGNSLI